MRRLNALPKSPPSRQLAWQSGVRLNDIAPTDIDQVTWVIALTSSAPEHSASQRQADGTTWAVPEMLDGQALSAMSMFFVALYVIIQLRSNSNRPLSFPSRLANQQAAMYRSGM